MYKITYPTKKIFSQNFCHSKKIYLYPVKMYLHLKIVYFHPLSFTECSGFVLNFIIGLNQGDLGGFFLAALVSTDHKTDNISILGCRILIGFTLEAHVRLLQHLTGPPTRFW